MNIIYNIYYSIIFLAQGEYNNKSYFSEKLFAFVKVMITFAPIAYVLKALNLWFVNNETFVSFFCGMVFLNIWTGVRRHRKLKSFNIKTLIDKTSEMLFSVITVYAALSMIAKIAGENVIAENFLLLIQVMTLVYPGSKIVKSVHILNGGKYPPKWVMDKFYNFEEKGDLKDFFDTNKKDDSNQNTEI